MRAASVFVAVDAAVTGRASTTAEATLLVKQNDLRRAMVDALPIVTHVLVGGRHLGYALRLCDNWNGHRRWVGGHGVLQAMKGMRLGKRVCGGWRDFSDRERWWLGGQLVLSLAMWGCEWQ